MILIPVKNLDTAKQRLASVLDQPARTALAQVMLQDVLARLAEWTERPAVAVVTNCGPNVSELTDTVANATVGTVK